MSACLSVCRVNDLVQLASSATLTASRTNVADSHQESAECHVADVTDPNAVTPKPMDTSSPAPPITIASLHPDNPTSTNSRERTRPSSFADNDVTSVKLPAIVTETHAQNYADVSIFTENVQSTEEAAVADSCITPSQSAVSSTHRSARSSSDLPLCTSHTKSSEENVSSVNSISSAHLAAPCVSSVTLPTSLQPPVNDVSLCVTSESSLIVEFHPTLATAATVCSDVVRQPTSAVCDVIPVTTSAPGTPVAGNMMTIQTSTLPANSVSPEMDPDDQLTLAAGRRPPGSTDNTPLPVVSSSKSPTHLLKHDTGLTTSVSSNTVNTAVTATRGCTATSVTSAINVLTSLMQRRKSMSSEAFVDTTTASVSKKRPHKLISPEVRPDYSAPEDNQPKRAKLDQSVDVVSAAAEPPIANKDASSADKVGGLTDTERISCYKTIGARKEQESVIGLRTAERLRRKTAVAASEVDCSRSKAVTGCDESNSSGSSSSPKKPARRVPLITVSAGVPSTPTVFTLRSRARLAQLQQKDTEPSTSQDSTVESLSHTKQAGVHEKSSAQADVVGNVEQTVRVRAVNSADRDKPNSSVSVVSQSPCESAIPAAAQPQGLDKSNQPLELQKHRKDGQSRPSQKHPGSDITAPSGSAAVTSRKSETSKPKSATTADANSKPDTSGKLSKPKSATSAVADNTSSSVKTLGVTASKPDNNRNAAIGGKTAVIATSKRQANIGTRSSARKGGKSDISEIVASRTVQDNLYNHLSNEHVCPGKAGHDKSAGVSNTKFVSRRVSSPGKNITSTCSKSEPVKAQQAASESSKVLDRNKQKMAQKDTIPVAEKRGSKITKDVNNRDTASSHRKSEPAKAQQAVSESTKVLDYHKQKDTISVAEKRVSKITKDVNSKRKASECTSEQTGSSQDVSGELCSRAKQTDVMLQCSAVITAASQPSVTADNAVAANKPPSMVAADKIVAPGIDSNVNHPQVVRRMSSRTDLRHTVTEKPASINCKLLTPRQQAAGVSFDLSSAVKTSSPGTELSAAGRESVDLFDVAIAGTPAQYPPSADDSFDSSLMLSPYNADVADDAAHDDMASVAAAAAEFTVPDNPVVAEHVDASLFGKPAVSMMLVSTVYICCNVFDK